MRGDRWWVLLPRQIRELPADLGAILIAVLLTNLSVVVPFVNETPVRVLLGIVFVLFVPGYAFVTALFPEAGASPTTTEAGGDEAATANTETQAGIDALERVALSFGTSIALVPLIGLVLNFTPWGIRLGPVLFGVSAFTVGATVVAAQRRRALPPDERFSVPYRSWYRAGRREFFEPSTRADAALNVLLAISVVLAVSSVTYAIAVPKQGESFSEFYLLTTSENGDLVADEYPTEFSLGESKPVVVGIGNQEHEQREYEVVVELQDVRFENNSTVVLRERELERFRTALAHNETRHRTYNVTPTMTGERLRVAFLLYQNRAPSRPSLDTAYRETHLWINVSESEP